MLLFFILAAGLALGQASTGAAPASIQPPAIAVLCPTGFVCVPDSAAAALITPKLTPVAIRTTQQAAGAVGPAAVQAKVCPSFYAAGVSRNSASSPQWSGWGAVATALSCGSAQPAYSITIYNVQLLKSGALQNTMTTGIALPFRTFGKITLYAFGTAGAAAASVANGATPGAIAPTSTTSLQGAFSGGGAATIPIWKGITATPWVQILKGVSNTATIIGAGFGYSW